MIHSAIKAGELEIKNDLLEVRDTLRECEARGNRVADFAKWNKKTNAAILTAVKERAKRNPSPLLLAVQAFMQEMV